MLGLIAYPQTPSEPAFSLLFDPLGTTSDHGREAFILKETHGADTTLVVSEMAVQEADNRGSVLFKAS